MAFDHGAARRDRHFADTGRKTRRCRVVASSRRAPNAAHAPIISVGSAAFNAGAPVTVSGVSGSATLIVAARTGAPGTGRIAVTLYNNGSQTVTICMAAGGTSGFPLAAGAALTLNTMAAVYGFVPSGSCVVAFVETY
jgi:hypothetical protein